MMDRKKILEEGLLEKYLLDELSETENQQVTIAIAKDQVLRQAFEKLEADFEAMAFENAIVPPLKVKERLQMQLDDPKVQYLPQTWLMVAASLTVIFLLSTFWMYYRWQQTEENYNNLQDQTTVLQERLNTIEENYTTTNQQLQRINGPQTIPLVLNGNDLSPSARVVAYVNHDKKTVLVNTQSLPNLPEDKTYQMWSDVNGEMINMGLVSPEEELVTLNYIEDAESLNITIEPAGGNDHPTVEQLIAFATL
ncbi:anti-sigma factor [uncultured Croceitalea sp.]|uniref:anti-sigma factor n=1 Tax=uncultured Croceitalea sp. TaxID=1798908 RepID=UPI00330652C4